MNASTPGADSKNILCLDLGSSPQLKDWASRLPDGEEFTIEITATKVGLTGDELRASVTSIAPHDFEQPVSESVKPGEVKPDEKEAVAVKIGPEGY